ncbi:hypothetical protein BH11PLA1_BH11PLA1_01210 [soil metagenome]
MILVTDVKRIVARDGLRPVRDAFAPSPLCGKDNVSLPVLPRVALTDSVHPWLISGALSGRRGGPRKSVWNTERSHAGGTPVPLDTPHSRLAWATALRQSITHSG